jgi:acetyl-CoA acetyltransferase
MFAGAGGRVVAFHAFDGLERYVYGDSTSGQAAMARVGLSGVPIINVNNNCCTGSTAIFTARQMVRAGHDCVLAVGFEKMGGNLKDTAFPDRMVPPQRHFDALKAAGASSTCTCHTPCACHATRQRTHAQARG